MRRRGAIIGFGNVAIHGHLPGWLERPDVELVAVADARPDRRPEAAARLPRARWHDDPAELLTRETLDFVDISTPPSSHAALAAQALDRGVHVLCEKPLVITPAELDRVVALAAARRRVLHAVHNWHHAPIIRRAAELVRAGAVGRVRRVVWQTLRTRPAAARDAGAPNWRVDPAIAGGGVLSDHGWHVFYVLRRWLGQDPVAVSARLERRRHVESPVEDTAEVQVVFPDARADILLTWAADSRDNRVEIAGTDGTLSLEDDTLVLARQGGAVERWPCPPALSDGSQHPDWFAPVVDGFISEIGGAAPGENLAEASLCVALEAAARESSRRGGPMLPVTPLRSAARGPAA